MASEFLRMVVVVELRDPPERLHGSVTGIEAGQSLTLSNVWSLDNHSWQPQVVVCPANIVEIFDASKDPNLPPTPAPAADSDRASTSPVYDDPAIISLKLGSELLYSKSRSRDEPSSNSRPDADFVPTIPRISRVIESIPLQSSLQNAATVSTGTSVNGDEVVGSRITTVSLDATAVSDAVPTGFPILQAEGQKPRRRGRQARIMRTDHTIDVDHTSAEKQKKPPGRGKGWRETPMLQDTASFQPFNALKKSGRRRQQPSQDNGWASEDVTDVQELGDFDFEGGLAKFDKRTLFDQMRREDQVSDADRLVTHNRRSAPKPGTAGGKNLHYLENVLDLPPTTAAPKAILKEPQTLSQDFWNSEADDVGTGMGASGGARSGGREVDSRQNLRRGDGKTPKPRRSQSRKASTHSVGQGPGRAYPVGTRAQFGPADLERQQSHASFPVSTAHGLYLLPSQRRLETISALQMLNLENIARNELGLTEDIMAENAGRGIAEATLIALADPAIKIRTGATTTANGPTVLQHSSLGTVVVLAGNNKSGMRATVGARHLRSRGINVLVCVVGIERGESELLEDFRQQLQLYRNFGGHIYTKSELFEYLRKATIPTLTVDTPRSAVVARPPVVALIVDALLGLAISFDELRTGDQATVYELIKWANRNEAFVLAVDVPTGIDPTSGEVSIIDGARLYVRPRYVIAMGAPKRGLLEAVSAGESEHGALGVLDDPTLDWRLLIADIGLGAAVWKKAGTKIRRGIDFDDKWLLEMTYQGE